MIILDTTRFAFEALAAAEASAAVTHQGAEVLVDVADILSLSTGAPEVARFAFEVIAKNPARVAVTNQGAEVLVDVADILSLSTGAPEVARFAFEVIGRRFIPVADSTLPAGLLFFAHNWASGCSLSNAYSTDVAPAADSLAEERRQLWDRPQRELKVSWTVEGLEAVDAFLVEMRRYVDRDMAVPLYCDVQDVAQTSTSGQGTVYVNTILARFFPQGHVAILHWDPDTQSLTAQYNQISTKTDDRLILKNNLTITATPGLSWVVPIVHCDQVLILDYKAHRNLLYTVEATFSEIYGPTALPPLSSDMPGYFDSFDGYPILSLAHDWKDGLTVSLEREGTRQSIGRGTYVDARGARHKVVHTLSFLGTRESAWKYIQFFDSRRGRLRPYWLIDLEDIWTVLEINTVSDFIAIDPLGDFTAFEAEMDYIGIEFTDGTSIVREAVTFQEVLGVWRVTTATDLPSGYTPADVLRVGRARLCRNKNDSMTENWSTAAICSFDIPVIELLEEKDVNPS